jgi:hypothetical protein
VCIDIKSLIWFSEFFNPSIFSRLDEMNTQVVKAIRQMIIKLVMKLGANNNNIIEKKTDLSRT